MSTYTPIASVTLSSAQPSVTFSGIPQTYTDLVVVISSQCNRSGANDFMKAKINTDTGSNYSLTSLYGTGSAAGSGRTTNATYLEFGVVPYQTEFGVSTISFNNYANATTYKTVLSRYNHSGHQVGALVNLWRSTAAITALEFTLINGSSFVSGSTFNLYGVANASITNIAKAAGGDTITTDGTYWYHTFLSSGTFTPTEALTVDYLVVAGGGGSDKENGGGGGAGGYRTSVGTSGGGASAESPLTLNYDTSYTVTIGAGGAASGLNAGSNSVFSTITSTGGGYGGDGAGGTGGSGGGAGGDAGTVSGGAGTANQGYAGGNATAQTRAPSAGGGGAGGAGSNNASSQGGNGGVGISSSITGSAVFRAGGGGGGVETGGTAGTGGNGGGGNGANTNGASPENGTVNTGGGAGGSSGGQGSPGAQGGSGIIIVRYPV